MLSSIKRNFDTVINTTVLVCVVSLVVFFSYKYFFPSNQTNSYKDNFAEGKFLAEIPELNEGDYEKSVVLILNTDCKFCNESLNFYKNLANLKYDKKSTQIVALFLQPRDIVEQYASKNNFPIRSVPSASFEQLKVGLTPTIVIINNKREVIKSWFGRLKPEQEQEVANILTD